DIPVVGAVHSSGQLGLVERHLGLMPSNEARAPDKHIQDIGNIVLEQVDVELLQQLAMRARMPVGSIIDNVGSVAVRLKIGVARDVAFGFYYADDLEALERYGAELVYFSPVADRVLPDVDGIFIGGGFPETSMEMLEANVGMRQAMAGYIERGYPVYAECGGLMYLCRNIIWGSRVCAMVGVIDA
ncbi:hypothetical protein TI04_13805, partial [Achromatium sp. WMS2]